MARTRKVKLSIRLDVELYDMLCELMPLFNNLTEAMEYCLKQYQNSTNHLECLSKIGDLRSFIIKMEEKFNSPKPD